MEHVASRGRVPQREMEKFMFQTKIITAKICCMCISLYMKNILFMAKPGIPLWAGGGRQNTKTHLEPASGFHPNMISSKLLGIIVLEKKPKFFVCSGGGGGSPNIKRTLMYLEIASKGLTAIIGRASCPWGSCFIWINYANYAYSYFHYKSMIKLKEC